MKIGILSDIHGNLEALERALAFFNEQEVAEYLCLGDLVGYGPNPDECVQLVKGLRCTTVAGNHDHGVVGRTPLSYFNEPARKAIEWTRGRISRSTVEFLEALELVEESRPFHLVHASPSAPGDWEYIESWADIVHELGCFSEGVCLVAHTHRPFAVRKLKARAAPQRISEPEFELPGDGNKYLVNTGSVGQPRDGDPRLAVVIYDTKTRHMRFERLVYDVAKTQQKILNAGLPAALAVRLAVGR